MKSAGAVSQAGKEDNVNQEMHVAEEEEQKEDIEDLELSNNKPDHPSNLIL